MTSEGASSIPPGSSESRIIERMSSELRDMEARITERIEQANAHMLTLEGLVREIAANQDIWMSAAVQQRRGKPPTDSSALLMPHIAQVASVFSNNACIQVTSQYLPYWFNQKSVTPVGGTKDRYSAGVTQSQDRYSREKIQYCVDAMMFSIPRTKEKSPALKSVAGEAHTALKGSLAWNMVVRAETVFRPSQTSPAPQASQSLTSQEEDDDISASARSSYLTDAGKPVWITAGIIQKKHTQAVMRSLLSTTGSDDVADEALCTLRSHKRQRVAEGERTVGNDDIATEVVRKLYSILAQFLNKSRDAAKKSFLVDVGYIFLIPGGEVVQVHPTTEDIMRPSQIPDMLCVGGQSVRTPNLDLKNLTAYTDMLGKLSMLFEIEYEVTVCEEPGEDVDVSAALAEPDTGTITKQIDLMQVALQFCMAYVRVIKAEDLLVASKFSLRMVYVVAEHFKQLLQTFSANGNKHKDEKHEKWANTLLPGNSQARTKFVEGMKKISRADFNQLIAKKNLSVAGRDEGVDTNGSADDDDGFQPAFS